MIIMKQKVKIKILIKATHLGKFSKSHLFQGNDINCCAMRNSPANVIKRAELTVSPLHNPMRIYK